MKMKLVTVMGTAAITQIARASLSGAKKAVEPQSVREEQERACHEDRQNSGHHDRLPLIVSGKFTAPDLGISLITGVKEHAEEKPVRQGGHDGCGKHSPGKMCDVHMPCS